MFRSWKTLLGNTIDHVLEHFHQMCHIHQHHQSTLYVQSFLFQIIIIHVIMWFYQTGSFQVLLCCSMSQKHSIPVKDQYYCLAGIHHNCDGCLDLSFLRCESCWTPWIFAQSLSVDKWAFCLFLLLLGIQPAVKQFGYIVFPCLTFGELPNFSFFLLYHIPISNPQGSHFLHIFANACYCFGYSHHSLRSLCFCLVFFMIASDVEHLQVLLFNFIGGVFSSLLQPKLKIKLSSGYWVIIILDPNPFLGT